VNEQPFISVVIPVWNSPGLLAKCLTALSAQSYPRDRYEVVVVDNGSTDTTADIARNYPCIAVLSEPIAGSYRARNLGLKSARGEYVAFTDADCIPDSEWLTAGARAAQRYPSAGVLAGHIQLVRTSGSSRACEKYETLFSFNQARNVARYGVCTTANWLSPRNLLVELGGFDATLKSGGDSKFARQIHATGHPIVYVPEMLVQHPMRGTLQELAKKQRRVVGGRWMMWNYRFAFIRWLGIHFREFAAKVKAIFFEPRLSIADKLQVALVAAFLAVITLTELVRISLGGEPRRS
jgi:cellulose synthase/poly-beta-1,6-N-acetylglucosamine synthase-like glycosyltransferase